MATIASSVRCSALLIALLASAGSAHAALATINGIGAGGWTSGDTRPSYSPTGPGTIPIPASASEIAAQIKFLGEGEVVSDAAGGTPSASPSGTLGGRGAVRLDGTSGNGGKSDIGYLNTNGIAAASALVASDFSLSYSWLRDPNPTSRTLGLGLSVSDGSSYYTFSYSDPSTGGADVWIDELLSASSGKFRLYGVSGRIGSDEKTLTEWASDANWGHLLEDTFDLVRVNFNIGSSQRNALIYIDWVQSNLLNGGDVIDFVSADYAATVPEPTTLALGGLALIGLAAARRRKQA